MRNVGSGQRDAKDQREQRGEKRIGKKDSPAKKRSSVAVTAAASERASGASVKRRFGGGV